MATSISLLNFRRVICQWFLSDYYHSWPKAGITPRLLDDLPILKAKQIVSGVGSKSRIVPNPKCPLHSFSCSSSTNLEVIKEVAAAGPGLHALFLMSSTTRGARPSLGQAPSSCFLLSSVLWGRTAPALAAAALPTSGLDAIFGRGGGS